jgi:hypothetical protein
MSPFLLKTGPSAAYIAWRKAAKIDSMLVRGWLRFFVQIYRTGGDFSVSGSGEPVLCYIVYENTYGYY